MTQSPSLSPSSTSHSMVPWAKSLISRSTATPQPSIIIPVCPVGTNDGAVAGRQGGPAQLERDGHLADRAVAADGQDHPLAGCVAAPDGRLHPVRRPPVVDDRHAPGGRGRRELRVVADERVQAGQDVQPGGDGGQDDRPPRVGQPAAGRRDPDQERVGRTGRASASSSDATIGMSKPGR